MSPTPWLSPLDPPPAACELPERFPSPFDELGPHALARRAAETVQAELRRGAALPEGGKMFGVLVVQAPDGTVGFLRSFSGMLGGRWEVEGYVPPAFDRAARAEVEPPGEALVKRLFAQAQALSHSSELASARAAEQEVLARHDRERAVLRARHQTSRAARRARRAQPQAASELHALDQQSRADKAERRRLEERQRLEAAAVALPRLRLERRARAADRLQRIVCRAVMRRLHDTYVVPSARGERRPLRSLFPAGEPPSGAGDCAGPKLLAFAATQGLRPLALAEFWWGAPPRTGGRHSGAFYPACRDKCGPLLPFLLDGLEVAPRRAFTPPDSSERPLPVLYEDDALVVIDKPAGLLSVPAKDQGLTDSVLARLRVRYPRATGPLLVHRLDLDTSGLLLAALSSEAHRHLQRQFAAREVLKRYVAVLEGIPPAEAGTIELSLRVDLLDRPRQIHDPVHGKPAVTDWRVLGKDGQRTRVALFPRTGRTHQLRAHAAHPLGLAAPIVGDRLYGHPADRLMLHAEAIWFEHPRTGRQVTFESPAPF